MESIRKDALQQRRSVLVVDDAVDLLELLRVTIEMRGDYYVYTASSLSEVEAVKETILKCDLTILDINLGAGEPNGIDICHWLRSYGYGGQISFLTGHADSHPAFREANRINNVKVFSKPMTMTTLHQLLDGCD